MKKITEEELTKIEGGISFWVGAAIVAGIVFLVGAFDGFTRPLKCRK